MAWQRVLLFFTPALYLVAMGVLLGGLIDRNTGGIEGLPYLEWLAPGLLTATAMQTGAGDSAWPVLAGIKWQKTYQAALATPLSTTDLVIGHLAWVATRLLMVITIFAGVAIALGAMSLRGGILAIVPALLTGLAFAAFVTFFAATLDDGIGLTNLFRFGIMPLFLFSGTFFEISRLPDWMEPVAYFTPLWHGVELTRGWALGSETTFVPIVHGGVLVFMIAVSTLLASRQFAKRMVV